MTHPPQSSPFRTVPPAAPASPAPRRPPDLRSAQELHKADRLPEAESAYRQWLSFHPADAAALHGLGLLNHQAGRQHEALGLLRQAVRAAGNAVSAAKGAEYRSNLAAVMGRLGRHAEAAAELAEVVRVRPDYAEGHCNLGVALEHSGRKEEATAAYRRAIALKPDYAQAFNSLGNCLRKMKRVDEAESAYRQAVRLMPGHAGAYNNLAVVLSGQGRLAEVIACRRKVAELRPGSAAAGSALLSTLHYDAASTPGMLLEAARAWAGKHAAGGSTKFEARSTKQIQSTKSEIQSRENAPSPRPSPGVPGEGEDGAALGGARQHANVRDAGRRLRVGFVSSNLSGHPEGRFLRPLLANLDREAFTTTCYCAGPRADAVTALLRQLCDRWRDIRRMSDEQVAAGIRQDQIDILVDLTGHFGGNRLGVFARKPAPVQIIHFGFPGTSGMDAMDWRVTDGYVDPCGEEGADKPGAQRSGASDVSGPGPDMCCSEEGSGAPLRCASGLSGDSRSIEGTGVAVDGSSSKKTPTLPSPGVPGEGKSTGVDAHLEGNAAGPPLAASQTETARPPGIPSDDARSSPETARPPGIPSDEIRYTSEKLLRIPGLAWVYDEEWCSRGAHATCG